MKKLFLFYLLFPLAAAAQTSPILESYIQEGLKQNLGLKQERLEIEKSLENINQAKANFMPKLTFNPNYTLAAGGRKLSFPIGDLLNPVYSTLNQLTKTNNFPQVENVNQLLAPNNFHDTKFNFQYPIFNTDIRYNLLIQRDLLTAQEAKKRILENEIRYSITTAYLQYLQTLEAQKIFDASRNLLTDFVKLNEKLVGNNVATKDVIYSAEYEVSKLDQQVAVLEKNRETVKVFLNYLMNRELMTEIVADTNLVNRIGQTAALPQLKEDALSNRQELNMLRTNIKVSETAIKLQEMNALRPQVFVGGSTGFQGFGYTFKDQAYILGQIGLSWDIYHGYEKKSKIQQAKIQKNILDTKFEEVQKQIQLQVSQAYFELEASKKALNTAKEGTLKAEKYFKVVESRYRNGQAIMIEYLRASNEVITARLQESVARYDILLKQANLDKVGAVK
ncbi:outer membrane efflux protein [Emticicia oligotrophica DSM 17448]|uniref:Outer membrane efflux protein n=1 Tax=Emticicia oligotrophica (strain DSM 17448 / CIP 109782 / MTCC 6937 / GPTSA100-15) TaxID=929562 RepID=A0ABM5N000_EMTOG|nr:TolC family protein [Emticicia oligotrophica]AFK02599.1 outer membrane efflux protein [Emticicia oligotrophica DSM 17448]